MSVFVYVNTSKQVGPPLLAGALLASAAYVAVRLALVYWSSRDRGKGSDANNGRR